MSRLEGLAAKGAKLPPVPDIYDRLAVARLSVARLDAVVGGVPLARIYGIRITGDV